MRVRSVPFGLLCSLTLFGCPSSDSAGVAVPAPPASPVAPSPCELAAAQRARIPELLEEGRLHRVVRVLDKADQLCPASAADSATARETVLGELNHADGQSAQALFEAGLSASTDRPRMQRLFDRAIAQAERETGSQLSLDLPHEQTSLHSLWSPDGRVMAVAQGDRVSILERRVAFRETRRLGDFDGPVTAIAFSPNGKILAAGAEDNTVRLWDTSSWVQLRHLNHKPNQPRASAQERERSALGTGPLPMPEDVLNDVAFSPDGSILVTATTDGGFGGNLRLWDVAEGIELRELEGLRAGSFPVQFAADGKTLSASSYQEGMHTWDVATGVRLAPIEPQYPAESPLVRDTVKRWLGGANASIALQAAATDHKRVAFVLNSSTDRSVHLLDVASANELSILGASAMPRPLSLEFSPDGSVLAIEWPAGIALVDAATGNVTRALRPLSDQGSSHYLALSLDGTQLATGSSDHHVHLWTLEPKTTVRSLGYHESTVHSVALSADGKTLASCSAGGVVVWSTKTGALTRSLPIYGSASVAFSRDGQLAAGVRGAVELWDVSKGERTAELRIADKSEIAQVGFSPDGRIVSGSTAAGELYSWTVASSSELPRARGARFVYSPNGGSIAAATGQSVIVTSAKSTQGNAEGVHGHERVLEGPTDSPRPLLFSPDGATLLTGSRDHTVRFWDLATGAQTQKIQLTDAVVGLAFLPNRKALWISSSALELWTPESTRLLQLVSLFENDAGYAVAAGATPYVEIVGPLADLAVSALQCKIGPLVFPFQLCRERLEVPGMVQKAIAGDRSFVDP